MKGEIKLCLTIYCSSKSPAGKHTQLSLITIQVVCNIYNTMLQPGRSHGLVCVYALYYIMLLEKSGVLQTCQHCNTQEYNSIQQTDLATKSCFRITKQLYLHHLNLKPLLLQKPTLGNVIKDISGGGHRVTFPMRGPAKFFLLPSLSVVAVVLLRIAVLTCL